MDSPLLTRYLIFSRSKGRSLRIFLLLQEQSTGHFQLPNFFNLDQLGAALVGPNGVTRIRAQVPKVIHHGNLIPLLHTFNAQTTFFLRQTNLILSHLGSFSAKGVMPLLV